MSFYRLGYTVLLLTFSLIARAQHPFEAEIQAFETADKQTPPPANPIVFTGSSSIRGWNNLQGYFPGKPVLNRGFGGSQLNDVRYYADRTIIAYHPKQVVLYAGENDVAGGLSARQTYDRFVDLFQYVRRKLPKVSFVFISLKPSPSRRQYWPVVQQTNELVRQFLKKQRRTQYVDIYTPMLDEHNQPFPAMYRPDSLHMLPKGYNLWADKVRPVLR